MSVTHPSLTVPFLHTPPATLMTLTHQVSKTHLQGLQSCFLTLLFPLCSYCPMNYSPQLLDRLTLSHLKKKIQTNSLNASNVIPTHIIPPQEQPQSILWFVFPHFARTHQPTEAFEPLWNDAVRIII